MSRENVARLRQAYADWNARDLDSLLTLLAPSIELYNDPSMVGAERFSGREGVRSFLEQLTDIWHEFQSEPELFVDGGERIVAYIRSEGTFSEGYAAIGNRRGHLVRFDGDQAVEWRIYLDRADALREAGLGISSVPGVGGNIELLLDLVDAYRRRDVDAMMECVQPDAEWSPALASGIEGEPLRGREGFEHWLEDLGRSFETWQVEVDEIRDLGEDLVWYMRIHARGRESGAELDTELGGLLRIRDGKVATARSYLNPADALRDAVLGQPARGRTSPLS